MWLQMAQTCHGHFQLLPDFPEKSLMPTQPLKTVTSSALSHFTRVHSVPTREEPGHGTWWCHHKEKAFSLFIRSESRMGSAVGTGQQRDGHQQLLGHSWSHRSHHGRSVALPRWQGHLGHQLGQSGLFPSSLSNKFLVSPNSLQTSRNLVLLKTLWVPFSA